MRENNYIPPKIARRHALFLMILIPFLWSLAGIFTRQLMMVKNVEIVFWRSFFTALFVAVYLLISSKKRFLFSLRSMRLSGFLSSVMWAVIFTCFMLSLTLTTVANTLIIGSITPLLTAVFAWFFLKQKTSFKAWIAIFFAFLGVVWIFVGSEDNFANSHFTGLLFALAVPFAYASNYLILSKTGKTLDMMPSVFVGAVISFIVMTPLVFPLEASVHDVTILAVLGVFQLGVPCLLLVYVSRFLLPAEMALIAMLEMVLGPLWVWIGVGEVPSQETMIGGSVVLLCLLFYEVVLVLQNRRKKSSG